MQIRPATLDDVPTLNRLVNGAYRGDSSRKGWTTEADLLDGIRTSESSLTRMIETPNAIILIVGEPSAAEACVYLEQQADKLYLGMLTVEPALQGKGIGATLMEASEEWGKSLGCQAIQMSVLTERKSLIAYYERKGYKDTGQRKPFPDDPAFGIPKQPLQFMIMEKQL